MQNSILKSKKLCAHVFFCFFPLMFDTYDLDSRILRAIDKMGYREPTLVQDACIPLALQGKDILAKARTGSGKTDAYLIPIIQKLLVKSGLAIVLVPTKELCLQVEQQAKALLVYCPNIACTQNILVATPAKLVTMLQAGLDIAAMHTLVIDEADLILSYGYDQDLNKIMTVIPKIYQCFLMSATLSEDIEKLKKLTLRNPAVLKLQESEEQNSITQYYTRFFTLT
jgi:ATP-dependent RNA helicase DDX56/DBP9